MGNKANEVVVEMAQSLRFRDVKMYDVPDSLDDLHGPHDGVVELTRFQRSLTGKALTVLESYGFALAGFNSALTWTPVLRPKWLFGN